MTMSRPARVRSAIWVAAYLRRCQVEGAYAVLRRRGAEEAGAIFVRIDRLDGTGVLYGPAPQSALCVEDGRDRAFVRMHDADALPAPDIETLITRELRFDTDLWLVEVEDRAGRSFLDDIVAR